MQRHIHTSCTIRYNSIYGALLKAKSDVADASGARDPTPDPWHFHIHIHIHIHFLIRRLLPSRGRKRLSSVPHCCYRRPAYQSGPTGTCASARDPLFNPGSIRDRHFLSTGIKSCRSVLTCVDDDARPDRRS